MRRKASILIGVVICVVLLAACAESKKLSDDLYDFQISIDGVIYQFPMQYSDFEELGWEHLGDGTDMLEPDQITNMERWKKDGCVLYTEIANVSRNTAPLSDCTVIGLRVYKGDIKDEDWEIRFPGGIRYGVSNAEDIRTAYGDPTSEDDNDRYHYMIYRYDSFRKIELFVDKETGVLDSFDIDNLIKPEGSENSVSDAAPKEDENDETLFDFQISMDGTVYQFPMWYSDFEALGWEHLGDGSSRLKPGEVTAAESWEKDGYEVYAEIANVSMNTAALSDCEVIGLTINKSNFKNCDWEILLPGGIQYGVSNADDIKAAYGEPSSADGGELYYRLKYKYDFYREITLYVYKQTDTLGSIEIYNMIELEGADNSVKDAVPVQVKNYKTPEELGNDLYSFHVELEGSLYKLPCPVSIFLKNGFQIYEEKSDMTISAQSHGWVELKYNNQTMRVMVRNYADYAAAVENCFVTLLRINDFDPKLEIVIPGNIKCGDSEEDVKRAVNGFETEVRTSDAGYTYYTVCDPKGRESDHYCICLKDGNVKSIEVICYTYAEE